MTYSHTKPQYPILETFAILGVSPPVGYRLIKDGYLKTHCIGRNRYASAKAIDRCIERLGAAKKKDRMTARRENNA